MEVLYLGNFLNNVKGRYDGPNVQVVKILQSQGHKVRCAGTSGNQFLRLIQFVLAIFKGKVVKTELIIIDVFSTRAFYFASISACFARLMNIKYALVLHGGNLPERFKSSKKLSRRLLEKAALIFSPSNYLASAALSEFDIKVKVIPNRIDVCLTDEVLSRNNEIYWVRSLSSIYNPEMALEVLRHLTEAGLDFKLIFIGPGDADRIKAVEAMVTKYNLNSLVEMKGRMPRKDWHNLAMYGKYFINTTYVDNTPSSLIEAMALGLVPISTNVGGIPFILEHEKDCILVDPNDAAAMAKAIKMIEEDTAFRQELQSNGRLKFESVYHASVISKSWEEALAQLA